MAGGVMNQVTGLIPGMKKEEEVPDVAPQEGEYQEYTVGRQQDLHSNGILLLMYFSILQSVNIVKLQVRSSVQVQVQSKVQVKV